MFNMKILQTQIGATANHATKQEAEELSILCKEFDVILLGLRKIKMTKARLLYELDKSPGNEGKRLKLKRLMDDIDLYHGKASQKKRKIIRRTQGVKWREENKKKGPLGPFNLPL